MLPRNNFTVRFANLFSLGGVVRRDSFYKCEYDLTEIQSAAEADSYLKVAMQRYKQLFFKAGYVFRGIADPHRRRGGRQPADAPVPSGGENLHSGCGGGGPMVRRPADAPGDGH